jgi:glycosyltransferase involved in cell wall biosynthesis
MFCGGQGIYVYNLSNALAAQGHEVHVLAGPPLPRVPEGVRLHVVDNLNLYGKKPSELIEYPLPTLLSPLNFMEWAATRVGMFPEMLTFSVRAFKVLKTLLGKHRFHVIHDNQSLGYGLLLMRGLGIPLVATIHHPLVIDRGEHLQRAAGLKEKFKRFIYYPMMMQHIVARGADRVIAVSRSSAEEIIKTFHVRPDRLRVVYNGVDTVKFSPSPDAMPDESNRIIFVGNTDDRKKGFIYLLEAMQAIGDSVKLTVVNGADRRPLIARKLARRMGLLDRIEFLSGISDERLVEEYRKASVAVVPSTYEGFGFPAAEAMSCGVPVVVAEAGALPEVVGREGAGILVAPKEPSAIAGAVQAILKDEMLSRRLREGGRRRILDQFSWRRAASETVGVYQEAISAYHKL